jgi:hypothetical protein
MPRSATTLNFVIPTGADPDFLDRKSESAKGRDLQFHSDRTQMPAGDPQSTDYQHLDSLSNPNPGANYAEK